MNIQNINLKKYSNNIILENNHPYYIHLDLSMNLEAQYYN
jgi:hypothetical protein